MTLTAEQRWLMWINRTDWMLLKPCVLAVRLAFDPDLIR